MKMTPKTGTNERRAWRLIAVLTSMWLWQAVVHGQEPASGGEAVFELEAYNVYAAATESAIVKKRESDTVGSYLGADSLADLPDDDLGEALSRLAGVNVVGGGGTSEANVTIRGAEGQYNTIRINGALQANARLGSRNYDLNQIPTEMVASVEVIKSITAEYPADSIGGAVNIETASAFNLPESIGRYKVESRYSSQGDEWGWGGNVVYADVYDVGAGKDNFGMFLNFNYIEEDFITWGTQNRFLSTASRLDSKNPTTASFANQTILSSNEDAAMPIWDRFDPAEGRVTDDELTFNASFDYKLGDRTTLFFRPWYQKSSRFIDLYAVRMDRIERAFGGNWYFLDESGAPLGTWTDKDGDGVLGSAGDTFAQAVDAAGNLIVTKAYEANNDGRLYRAARDTRVDSTTYTLDVGGETAFDKGILDYRVLYSVDDGESLQREWRFEEAFNDARNGNQALRARITDGSTPLPEFTLFEVTAKKGHVPANNAVNETGNLDRSMTNVVTYAQDQIYEDVFLAETNYDHRFSERFSLKMGVRHRVAQRENNTNQLFFSPSAGAGRVFPAGQVMGTDGAMTLFDGKYADAFGPYLVAAPAYDFLLQDIAANPGNWVFNRGDLRDATDTGDLEEAITAAYLQGTWRLGNMSVVAGIRYERTELDVTWRASNFVIGPDNIPGLTDADKANMRALISDKVADLGFTQDPGQFSFGDLVDDINRKNSYDNILPSVVWNYRFGDSGHVLRLAWTNTLTRPDYRELVPFDMGAANAALQRVGIINITNRDGEFDIGNPELVEQTAENWDLAWEYYFGPEQTNTISISLFKKELEDFLQEDVFQRDIEVLVNPEDPSQGTELIRSDSNFWSNASEANIEGVEISAYFNMGTLFPDARFLRGVSLVPNYTYITGDQTNPIYDENELAAGRFVVIGEELTDSLTNQAESIINIQLFYEMSRLNVRLSYNYISELQRTPSTAAISATTYDAEQERWDLSVQYRLFANSDTRIFVEADNLTDEPQDERFIGKTAGLYTTSYELTGRRIVVGIRGSF
ncbi:MAG: hypothetical protein RL648_776 [Verrucomicrobiota bacterium]